MDTRVSPVPTESAMAAEFRRQGLVLGDVLGLFRRAAGSSMDTLGPLGPVMALAADLLKNHPDKANQLLERLFDPPDYAFPDLPVSPAVRFFALAPDDDVDRVSRLPDELLGNVVSRLPVKDAARTALLSRRWRGVWRSAPLVLADADLFPATSAVSSVLAAHPGPVRCAHLTSSFTPEYHGLLKRWLKILADKGIQELVLVNRRWPLDFDLPATFLGMATLTRLYLGLWKFPCTAGISRATCFPNLRDLDLCSVIMEGRDLDFILDRSPVLENLCLLGNLLKFRIRLVSQSLRCVRLIACFVEEIFVVDAPRLEMLIHSEAWSDGGKCSKIKIGHAPKLKTLAFLHPRIQVLELGNTIIKARTRVSPSTMVPSVTVLAMEVHFGVRNDLKMIPRFLRCFPNVKLLHIRSGERGQSAGKVNLKFWHESGIIQCMQSSIKWLDFYDFHGSRSELAFLKFFFESALVLEEVLIVLATGFTSMKEVNSKVESLGSMKRASEASSVLVTGCSDRHGGYIRSFKRGSEFSVRDPFANYSVAPVCTCRPPFEICVQCLKILPASRFRYYVS